MRSHGLLILSCNATSVYLMDPILALLWRPSLYRLPFHGLDRSARSRGIFVPPPRACLRRRAENHLRSGCLQRMVGTGTFCRNSVEFPKREGGKPRGRLKAPDVRASLRQSPAPTNNLTNRDSAGNPAGTAAAQIATITASARHDRPKTELIRAALRPSATDRRPTRPPKKPSPALDFLTEREPRQRRLP